MTHHDTTRNIYIKFKSDKHRDRFLAKLEQAEANRMKHLAEVRTLFNSRVR